MTKKKTPVQGAKPATRTSEAPSATGVIFTHIDDFIDAVSFDRAENYAKFFFNLKRLSAHKGMVWALWISKYKLFCTFEGKRWRVTGASRAWGTST